MATCYSDTRLSGDTVCDFRNYVMNNNRSWNIGTAGYPIDTDVIWQDGGMLNGTKFKYMGHGNITTPAMGAAPGGQSQYIDESCFEFTWTIQPTNVTGRITDIWIDVGPGNRELYGAPTKEHIPLTSTSGATSISRRYFFRPANIQGTKETHAVVVVYRDALANQKAYVYYPVAKAWNNYSVTYDSATGNHAAIPSGYPIPLPWAQPVTFDTYTNHYEFKFHVSCDSTSHNKYLSFGIDVENPSKSGNYWRLASLSDGTTSGDINLPTGQAYISMVGLSTEIKCRDGTYQINPRLTTQRIRPVLYAPKVALTGTQNDPYSGYMTDVIQDW
jgi:hypothetical protein